MTRPTETETDIRAACEEAGVGVDYLSIVKIWPYRPISRLIEALARRIAAEREAVPVGITGEMPGSNGGFSMAVFKADDVPIGAKLYAAPPKEPNT